MPPRFASWNGRSTASPVASHRTTARTGLPVTNKNRLALPPAPCATVSTAPEGLSHPVLLRVCEWESEWAAELARGRFRAADFGAAEFNNTSPGSPPRGTRGVHFRGRGPMPIFKENYCPGLGFNQSETKKLFKNRHRRGPLLRCTGRGRQERGEAGAGSGWERGGSRTAAGLLS